MNKFEREFETAFENEMNNINSQLEKEINFALIVDVNSGNL
ncbi:hypothetical protein [Halalkalibacter sp. APA_J-10(15)]|nr:hypothetical protein [Halalkalibacter sp. APA_J-10(15)]